MPSDPKTQPGAFAEEWLRDGPLDPKPSPLEGIEIPESYERLEDWMIPDSLYWLRHADLSRTRTMAALWELAEHRLADRRAAQVDHFSQAIDEAIERGDKEFLRSYFREKRELAREEAPEPLASSLKMAEPDHHEAVAQSVAYLEGRGYRVISKDVAARMAQALEVLCESPSLSDALGLNGRSRFTQAVRDASGYAAILRGEKTDA